jgi:folate-dependent phosphoribosylglycinamide formyltransferase PurN
VGQYDAHFSRGNWLNVNIVLFTKAGFESDQLFLYMYARIAARFPQCAIVAVHPAAGKRKLAGRMGRFGKKLRRLGWSNMAEIVTSYPLQVILSNRQRRETNELLRCLPRPALAIDGNSVSIATTVNGPDAVEAIRRLNPDVLMQAGVGILRPQIFTIPRIACLNLHHGMAPLIRGMSSISWGLWERRPEWIGSTVHEIDEDIDTGNVLAYAPVQQREAGEGCASLLVRATEKGVDQLLNVLARLQKGERWKVPPLTGPSVYRSTMSGWKLAALTWRLNSEAKKADRAKKECRSETASL